NPSMTMRASRAPISSRRRRLRADPRLTLGCHKPKKLPGRGHMAAPRFHFGPAAAALFAVEDLELAMQEQPLAVALDADVVILAARADFIAFLGDRHLGGVAADLGAVAIDLDLAGNGHHG